MLNPQKISSIKPGGLIRALFIGENGTGKSTAAASFPEPILFYDFDKRMMPVRNQFPQKDIDFITVDVKNFGGFRDHLESLQDRNRYRTIVGPDSFTSFTTLCVVYQILLRGGDAKATKGGIAIPGFDEYNGETMLASSVIEILKSLNCNIIVTAHPLTKTESIGGKSVRSRVITSYGTKIATMLPGYFDEIYNFMIEPAISVKDKPRRVVHTQHMGTDLAKSAIPALPAEVDITDRYDFYDVLQSYIPKEAVSTETKPKSNPF